MDEALKAVGVNLLPVFDEKGDVVVVPASLVDEAREVIVEVVLVPGIVKVVVLVAMGVVEGNAVNIITVLLNVVVIDSVVLVIVVVAVGEVYDDAANVKIV